MERYPEGETKSSNAVPRLAAVRANRESVMRTG